MAVYLLFALAGGFSLATFFAASGNGPTTLTAALSVFFLFLAWGAKLVVPIPFVTVIDPGEMRR